VKAVKDGSLEKFGYKVTTDRIVSDQVLTNTNIFNWGLWFFDREIDLFVFQQFD
jgi:hypothetical protein